MKKNGRKETSPAQAKEDGLLSRLAAWNPGSWVRGFALLAALACVLPAPVLADSNPDDDADSLTITILPVVDLGVSIDTGTVDLDFTMEMGQTDYTIKPATVTILGNIQPQELDVSGANVSGDPVWTLDADETADPDQLQLYSLFSVGRSTRPLEAEFDGVKNLITGATKRAGQLSGSGDDQNFEHSQMTGAADMDDLNVGDERQLWFRIDTPPQTSVSSEQKIQVTITATRSNM